MARISPRPSGTNAGKSLPRKASGSGLVNEGKHGTPAKALPLYGGGEQETQRARRDFSHFMLRGVQRLLYFSGIDMALAKCCQGLTYNAEAVEVRVFDDGRSGLAHVAHCGNSLCPVCGPRLAARRLEDAQQVAEYLLEELYSYLLVTFTASHSRDSKLSDLRKGMSKAWAGFYSSRLAKRLRASGLLSHSLKALEVTDDDPATAWEDRTGWHLHRHEVWFAVNGVWMTREQMAKLQRELATEWKRQLEKQGLTCSLEHGVNVESVQDWRDAKVKGKKGCWKGRKVEFDVLTRQKQQEHVARIVGYLTKSMGFELTQTGRKISRRGKYGAKRVSTWNLAELAVRLDGPEGEQARRRFLELVAGCRGVHWFTMSDGLRALAKIEAKRAKDETDNADALRMDEDDDHGIVVAKMRAQEVAPVMRQGRLGHLVSIAAGEVPEGVAALSWGGSVKAACRAAAQGIDILTGDRLTSAGPLEWSGPAATPYLRVSRWLQERQAGLDEARARKREREEAARRVGMARGRLYGGSLRDVDLLPRLLQRAADRRRGGLATMSPGQLRAIDWVFRAACWGEAAGMSERIPASCEWSPTREQVRLPGL